mmetsp:Transcript_19085/g.39230  ORF Transcript_19085/g.39230 Transcript_19085/m.39230 type:complete len:264 (+) Transcript_19085:123-914(+)
MIRRLSINSESVRSLELGVDDKTIKEYDRKVALEDDRHNFHLWQEMKLLLSIAAPAVLVQFSVLFIFPQTASIVGRTLGTEALAGFSLGSLVGNLTCVSIMAGALTAADILMPRAWGAKKYEEMGFLAVRGVIICSFFLLIPIIPLCTSMEWIFDRLGQDKGASLLASKWIRFFFNRSSVPALVPCSSVFFELSKPCIPHGFCLRCCLVRHASNLAQYFGAYNRRERISYRHLFDTMDHDWPSLYISSLQAGGETRNMAAFFH